MVYVVEVVVAVFGEVEELDEELLVCVRDVDEVLLCVCVVEGWSWLSWLMSLIWCSSKLLLCKGWAKCAALQSDVQSHIQRTGLR